jgi:alginate O-acetyltransferase complex protein AlgI
VFNLLLVWFLTGLWHGASWNYVLWGLYFFLFLVAEKYLLRLGAPTTNGRYIGRRAYLLLVVLFGWFLFRFEDMTALGYALRGLFLGNGSGFIGRIWNVTVKTQLLGNLWFLPVALLACTPIVPLLHRKLCDAAQKHRAWHVVRSVLLVVLPPVLLCLSVLSLVGDSYNPFLYFQF